jgi:uncharacterized Zn finger protein
MTPVDDFLTEKTLLGLAPPKAYIDGAAAAEHGSVRILERDAAHVRAEVASSPVQTAELRVRDDALEWTCTCGEAAEHLCHHLVAAALATWPDEVPDDADYD